MTKEEIEYYHNSGLMPDWIYYQVNGKTAEENYRDISMKRNIFIKWINLKFLNKNIYHYKLYFKIIDSLSIIFFLEVEYYEWNENSSTNFKYGLFKFSF